LPTIRLVYSSQAADGMTYSILVGIMAHAQSKNSARGITGILCYGSGQFLQALEGEREAVNALYHQIAADARHGSCQLIAVEEITQRAFPEWTMKVVNWEDGDGARRRAMLEADTGSSVFAPRGMTATQAATFLEHLADMERELSS
jgi:Sensors of blue-light using FAD